jgi:hypothetical protein
LEKRIQKIIDDLAVKMEVRHGAEETPENFAGCDPWTVILTNKEGRMMIVPFFMGRGHGGKEPTAEGVLECLVSDSGGYEGADNFQEWANEYGYDTDSREAEKIYSGCGDIARRLKRFLGEEVYECALWGC